MPTVEIALVPADQEIVLRRLFQLYAHDFSEFMGLEIGDDGCFALPDLAPYWRDPGRHPFFVRVGARLAGFALVHERSHLTGAEGTRDIAEFFIVRRHRRAGVGEHIATTLFARFPGAWEVRQRAANVGAIAFWRRVIDRFTQGRYREVVWDDGTWRGPVQSFVSEGPVRAQ